MPRKKETHEIPGHDPDMERGATEETAPAEPRAKTDVAPEAETPTEEKPKRGRKKAVADISEAPDTQGSPDVSLESSALDTADNPDTRIIANAMGDAGIPDISGAPNDLSMSNTSDIPDTSEESTAPRDETGGADYPAAMSGVISSSEDPENSKDADSAPASEPDNAEPTGAANADAVETIANRMEPESAESTDTANADVAETIAVDGASADRAVPEPENAEIRAVAKVTATSPARVESKQPPAKQTAKKSFYDLKFNELDRDLSPEQQSEWNAIYASYRSKSVLTGKIIGVDQHTFSSRARETGEMERQTMYSAIIIEYRVKVLIPEAEMWMPDESRPDHVLRNMVGGEIDYVIMDVDREGECAIASRRVAMASKRHYFATAKNGHAEGDLLECRVLAVGPKRCLVECNGYDISLTPRDLSYTAIPDLREKYSPGQRLACKLKTYDKEAGRLSISVKEVNPNPFIGADLRHPVGSRRQAVISGKYGGGVFCTLPDETVCLCLYSSQHMDSGFPIGDTVIIVIRQYDYQRKLIYGRILAKW